MWFKNTYRRHLLDMHIDDWDDRFLSEFSPEKYYENLKTANIGGAMIYFQSHTGLCNYPTKNGRMHRAFNRRENAIKKLCSLCKDGGIHVVGYYSLNYNTWAHDEHPQWRMLQKNGLSQREDNSDNSVSDCSDAKAGRYGLCCPNNPGYRKFVFEQIAEMSEFFEFDGLFYDMLYWPHFCYCDSCKKRWKEEVGGELPSEENWQDEKWRLHVEKRRKWMGEWAQAVTAESKRLNPGISVEHNLAAAVGKGWSLACSESVNEGCDYSGGDLYGGKYHQSYTCKFYRNLTKNQPFEYMFARCRPNLSTHTLTKSDDDIKSSVFLTAAHHGATFVIDAIDPVGTMDERFYRKIGGIFETHKRFEPYFCGKPIEDIGIYNSLKSKHSEHQAPSNAAGCISVCETLIRKNILCGVTGGYHDISGYKAIIAPMLTRYDEYDNQRLIEFVGGGGTLYISGGDNPKLVSALLGCEVLGVTDETVTYLAPKTEDIRFLGFNTKYPLPLDGCMAVIPDTEDAIAYAVLPYTVQSELKYASIHSNPPGVETEIPAIVVKSYGKGRVIWSAYPIEASEYEEHRRIFLNLLIPEIHGLSITSDAPENLEITLYRTENGYLLNTVYLCETYKAGTIPPYSVSLNAEGIKSIEKISDNTDVPFTEKDGPVTFSGSTQMFEVYKINIQ